MMAAHVTVKTFMSLPHILWCVLVFPLPILAYIVYCRYFHPLAKYPGPFVASFTNLWKVYTLWGLHMPETLVQLHKKYGDVVRLGPSDLSFQRAEAIPPIYKAGRAMPKTAFYDGFTAFLPNLFGTQDEELHSVRRRQLAHGFSMTSIRDMEAYIDEHLSKFLETLDRYATTEEVFDLKSFIAFYVLDVLGELAFSHSFDAQTHQNTDKLPPINDHVFLSCLMGMMPDIMPMFKAVAPWMPLPWLQTLLRARKELKMTTATCVGRRIHEKIKDRKDLLTSLMNAVDPETGAKLTELEINTEAFAMVVAGSHTTSGTLTLLFAHLLQNPATLTKVVEEIDSELQHIATDIVPINGLEAILPYTMACVNENFRINPVFTMPLPRQVTATKGVHIDGHLIPKGTSVFCLNHVVHHNASIWGPTHEKFDPSRFLGSNTDYYKRNLIPFGVGHRMCIGRNIAMTNLLKVLVTVLRKYQLDMEDPKQIITTLSVGISEKEGPLMCRVRRRKTPE